LPCSFAMQPFVRKALVPLSLASACSLSLSRTPAQTRAALFSSLVISSILRSFHFQALFLALACLSITLKSSIQHRLGLLTGRELSSKKIYFFRPQRQLTLHDFMCLLRNFMYLLHKDIESKSRYQTCVVPCSHLCTHCLSGNTPRCDF
jgi:hypothetical protein